MTAPNHNNTIIDGVVAVGGLTLPFWAEILGAWLGLTVTILTLVLIVYRIILAHREWKRGQ